MGVQILSPENVHTKHLRSLPRIPANSHYSMKPVNVVKPSRALPTVPNTKVDANIKTHARALPRVPKVPISSKRDVTNIVMEPKVLKPPNTNSKRDSNLMTEHRVPKPPNTKKDPNHPTRIHRVLPEVPKDGNTSGSSRASTPHAPRALPKLPKLQKPKPEQNRIEYMYEVYKKEGDYHSDEGEYEKALKSYNLALKFISDDKAAILARSRVYRKLGKARKAMQDADLALKLDPIYYEGLLQKAELLLEQGDYENAIQHFQKGARMRPDKEGFHEGIERARHALADTHKHARKRKSTVSPEDVNISVQKKAKDKTKKNRDNANMQAQVNSFSSDERHSAHTNTHTSHSEPHGHAPPHHVPVPPPHPPTHAPPPVRRATRQQTPLPGRLKMRTYNPQDRAQDHPMPMEIPSEEDVDNSMIKQILGRMDKDKDFLEELLKQGDIDLPGTAKIGSMAENGLHFLYDRVLNWVRDGQGQIVPPSTQPTPLPRDTKASLTRRSLAHGSSVESIVEEQAKENEALLAKRKKKKEPKSKAPHTWYQYLENRKSEEAQERKHYKKVFLHVVEGHKIKPKEHSNMDAKKSQRGPETSRRGKENKLRRDKDFGSKESLTHGFTFKSYRPGSDMRNSKERHSQESEHEEVKTPPRKLKKITKKRTSELEKRRAALAKFLEKDIEEIQFSFADGKLEECSDKAIHCLAILENEDYPDKYAAMATLHSYLGNVAIERREYEEALKHHNIDLDIGEKHKIDEAISRALGNLGRIYVVQKRHQEALDVFLRKTPMCASRIETAWLFHEIGNCFLALGDFEYAKDAAKKSLEAAEEAVEWSYQLQSCVLMGVAEVKLKQYHAAFNTFERALEQSRLQGDEKAEEAIREALQDVNDRIVEEMKMKGGGAMDMPGSRSDAFTSLSRNSSWLQQPEYYGLSRSRAEIARMHSEFGYRNRADYAKSRAQESDYSSIFIPDDDGSVSLAETATMYGDNLLSLDLERLRTESTLFGSQLDFRDNIRSESFVSNAPRSTVPR